MAHPPGHDSHAILPHPRRHRRRQVAQDARLDGPCAGPGILQERDAAFEMGAQRLGIGVALQCEDAFRPGRIPEEVIGEIAPGLPVQRDDLAEDAFEPVESVRTR